MESRRLVFLVVTLIGFLFMHNHAEPVPKSRSTLSPFVSARDQPQAPLKTRSKKPFCTIVHPPSSGQKMIPCRNNKRECICDKFIYNDYTEECKDNQVVCRNKARSEKITDDVNKIATKFNVKTNSTNDQNVVITSTSSKTRMCRKRQGIMECKCGTKIYDVKKAVCYNDTILIRSTSCNNNNSESVKPKAGVKVEAGKFPEAVEKYRSGIETASKQTGVPSSLIAAVIWQESRGKLNDGTTNPENQQKDAGLMQVNAATFQSLQQQHSELQGKNVEDPDTNILAGAFYLSDMAKKFDNDWKAALRAYNSGPGNVDLGNLDQGPNGTDPDYVRKVISFQENIEKGGELSE